MDCAPCVTVARMKTLWTNEAVTVEDIKQELEDCTGLPIKDQRLLRGGIQLEDLRTLFDVGVGPLTNLQLLM